MDFNTYKVVVQSCREFYKMLDVPCGNGFIRDCYERGLSPEHCVQESFELFKAGDLLDSEAIRGV